MENIMIMIASLFVLVVCNFMFNIIAVRKINKKFKALQDDIEWYVNLSEENFKHFSSQTESRLNSEFRWISEDMESLLNKVNNKKR